MRRLGLIALFALGSLCALLVLFFAVDPLDFGLAVAEVAEDAFGYPYPTNPPAIAEGAPFDWLYGWPADPKWTAILKRRFPPGSSEAALETTLRQQGFKIDAANKSAIYDWRRPCLYLQVERRLACYGRS